MQLFYHGSGPKSQYDTIYLALLMPYFMFVSAMSITDEYYKHSDEVRSNAVLHVALFIVIQWDMTLTRFLQISGKRLDFCRQLNAIQFVSDD